MCRKYRVTYKPYTKTTTVERLYPDCTVDEWTPIGVKDERELKEVLDRREIIQKCGYDLIAQLEKYNDGADRPSYEIRFCGLEQDYFDFERIIQAYVKDVPDSKITGCVLDNTFPLPGQVITDIEKSWNEIVNLYNDDFSEIKQKLENVMQEETSKLNVSELTVLVVGMQNSGKSTLINALIGKKILPISSDTETAALFTVRAKGENYVEVKTEEGNTRIDIFDKGYKYTDAPVWLKDVIDTIKHKSAPSNIDERISELLKGINNACKESQNGGKNIPFIREIEIAVDSFGEKNYGYCIKDLPGAGADSKYLGKEHEKIIFDTIRDIANAVTIYVISADALNRESEHTFLDNLKKEGCSDDAKQSGIDFERSIYVLNKAESTNDTKEDIQRIVDRYDGYKGSKWVSTSAEPSLQLQTGERVNPRYNHLIKAEEGFEPTDLTLRSCLPQSYTPELVDKMMKDVVEGADNADALIRTGTPLVSALINDYAANAFAVHKVNCLYYVMNGIGRLLEEEEKKQLEKCERLQRKLEQRKDEIREEVKEKIRKVQNDTTIACSEKLLANVLGRMAELLKKYEDNIGAKWKDKAKEGFKFYQFKLGEKKKKLSELVNDAVNTEAVPYAAEKANTIKEETLEQYKKQLKDLLNEEAQSNDYIKIEDIENVKKKIDSFSTPPFKNKYVHKGVFLGGKKAVKTFDKYWSEEFISPFVEKLWENIDGDIKNLTEAVEGEIDNLSPALKANQEEIDKEKAKQELLKDKREKSAKIRVRCEKLYEEGVGQYV